MIPEILGRMFMSIPESNNPTRLFVAPISHFRSGDLALAGGKGANLGELSHTGFDVPPGFVITTAAYDLLLQKDALPNRLANTLTSLNPENQDAVKEVSQQICD